MAVFFRRLLDLADLFFEIDPNRLGIGPNLSIISLNRLEIDLNSSIIDPISFRTLNLI